MKRDPSLLLAVIALLILLALAAALFLHRRLPLASLHVTVHRAVPRQSSR